MKNIEKYEKEIRKYNGRFAVTKEGQVVDCSGYDCNDCLFLKGCTKLKMEWLMEEYKDPILNEKEKEILIKLIETNKAIYNTDVLFVEKLSTTNNFSKCYLYIMFENRNSSETITFYSDTIFSRMELNKHYTLKDLGL